MKKSTSGILGLLVLSACGGGNQASAVPKLAVSATSAPIVTTAAGTTENPSSKATTILTGTHKYALPSLANFDGSISITAQNSGNVQFLTTPLLNTTRSSKSSSVPDGPASEQPLFSEQITFSTDVSAQNASPISIDSSNFNGIDNNLISYTLYEGAGCARTVDSGYASGVSGNNVLFTGKNAIFTFQAGKIYTYVFYATQPSHAIYSIPNGPSSNTIGEVLLDSSDRPIGYRSITGSDTLLKNPVDVTTSPNGNVYAINEATIVTEDGSFAFSNGFKNYVLYQNIYSYEKGASGDAHPNFVLPIQKPGYRYQQPIAGRILVDNANNILTSYWGAYGNPGINEEDYSIYSGSSSGDVKDLIDAPGYVRPSGIVSFAISKASVFAAFKYLDGVLYVGKNHSSETYSRGFPQPQTFAEEPMSFDPATNNLLIANGTRIQALNPSSYDLRNPSFIFNIPAQSDPSAYAISVTFDSAGTFYVEMSNRKVFLFKSPLSISSTPSSVIDLSQTGLGSNSLGFAVGSL